ncbi:MAG: hypothetical protein GXO19_07270 [Epsilonproteobacteria bacterium]|nr:hypothetical protein [Campylobacterota bacterium]NPA57515.1 hypothetical protein [Campylobacterota bacterium]
MEIRFLKRVISFLSGVLWTLSILSLFFTFTTLLQYSVAEAIIYTLILAIFWLFLLILVEMAHLQIEKFRELRRQTQLLERIARKLDA